MHNVDGGAVARLPVIEVWLRRGESLGRGVLNAARRVEARIDRTLAWLGRAQARRVARRDLHRLDDRLLKDIGLRRDQVDEFVDAMFRADPGAAMDRPVLVARRQTAA